MKNRPYQTLVLFTAILISSSCTSGAETFQYSNTASYKNQSGNQRSDSESLNVNFNVKDSNGIPINGAIVKMYYKDLLTFKSVEVIGEADIHGKVQLLSKPNRRTTYRVEKEGYYSYGVSSSVQAIIRSEEEFNGMEVAVLLRKIINPIPLYSKNRSKGIPLYFKIPERGKFFGFDFGSGDWVKPFGVGERSDILFKIENKVIQKPEYLRMTRDELCKVYLDYLVKNGIDQNDLQFKDFSKVEVEELIIKFPNSQEGIVKVSEGYVQQCSLRMPHCAPESGYTETYRTYRNLDQNINEYCENIGFFIRTRVVLNEYGEVQSANYSKIHSDFQILANEQLKFEYHFNPIPNDRNLEFDTANNIFRHNTMDTKLVRP